MTLAKGKYGCIKLQQFKDKAKPQQKLENMPRLIKREDQCNVHMITGLLKLGLSMLHLTMHSGHPEATRVSRKVRQF